MLRIVDEALTFDDVLLLPAYSEILPKAANLTTRLTKSITLNLPLISAAMDTVTESEMAITMAQLGGLGILHKSMDIDKQAMQVRRVKKFEAGTVVDRSNWSLAAKIPMAIGKSRRAPSLGKSAGAKLIVKRLLGN